MEGTSPDLMLKVLQHRHSQKTKALMRSIDQLRQQVKELKAQGKESYRTSLIKTLKTEKREQELIVDFLKDHLKSTNGLTDEEVDDLVIKKTTGGPKRFRPKTREELNVQIRKLSYSLSKAESNLKTQQGRTVTARPRTITANKENQESLLEKSKHSDRVASNQNAKNQNNEANATLAHEASVLREQLDEYRISLVAKGKTISTQEQEIDELHKTLREFRIVQSKHKRLSDKYASMKQHMFKLRDASIAAAVEQEKLNEKLMQAEMENKLLQEEIMQRSEDIGDNELKQVNEIGDLKQKEVTLLDEIDDLKRLLAAEKQRHFEKSRTRESTLLQSASEIDQERQLRAKAEAGKEFATKKYKALETKMEDLQIQIRILGEENATVQAECNRLKDELSIANRLVKSQSSQVSQLEEQLEQRDISSRDETNQTAPPMTRSVTIGLNNPIFGTNNNTGIEDHVVQGDNELDGKVSVIARSQSSRLPKQPSNHSETPSSQDLIKLTTEVFSLTEKLRLTEEDLKLEKEKALHYQQVAETAKQQLILGGQSHRSLKSDSSSSDHSSSPSSSSSSSRSSSSRSSSSFTNSSSSISSFATEPSAAPQVLLNGSASDPSIRQAFANLSADELRARLGETTALVRAYDTQVLQLRSKCSNLTEENQKLEQHISSELKQLCNKVQSFLEHGSAEPETMELVQFMEYRVEVQLTNSNEEIRKLRNERDYQENLFLTLKTLLDVLKTYANVCYQKLCDLNANPKPIPDLQSIAKSVTMMGRTSIVSNESTVEVSSSTPQTTLIQGEKTSTSKVATAEPEPVESRASEPEPRGPQAANRETKPDESDETVLSSSRMLDNIAASAQIRLSARQVGTPHSTASKERDTVRSLLDNMLQENVGSELRHKSEKPEFVALSREGSFRSHSSSSYSSSSSRFSTSDSSSNSSSSGSSGSSSSSSSSGSSSSSSSSSSSESSNTSRSSSSSSSSNTDGLSDRGTIPTTPVLQFQVHRVSDTTLKK